MKLEGITYEGIPLAEAIQTEELECIVGLDECKQVFREEVKQHSIYHVPIGRHKRREKQPRGGEVMVYDTDQKFDYCLGKASSEMMLNWNKMEPAAQKKNKLLFRLWKSLPNEREFKFSDFQETAKSIVGSTNYHHRFKMLEQAGVIEVLKEGSRWGTIKKICFTDEMVVLNLIEKRNETFGFIHPRKKKCDTDSKTMTTVWGGIAKGMKDGGQITLNGVYDPEPMAATLPSAEEELLTEPNECNVFACEPEKNQKTTLRERLVSVQESVDWARSQRSYTLEDEIPEDPDLKIFMDKWSKFKEIFPNAGFKDFIRLYVAGA